jgi:hypothetical protein
MVLLANPGVAISSSNPYIYWYESGNVLLVGTADTHNNSQAAKSQFEALVGARVS